MFVRSVDDIPSSFASEDEERDWWATHDLSSSLYDQLRPSWNDIAEMSPLHVRASGVKQVQLSLSIARKHLGQLKRSKGPLKDHGDARLEHALIATVFSAAAVEAGLNLYLAAPALLLEDQSQRRFFNLFAAHQIHRMTFAEKLEFAQRSCGPGLRADLAKLSALADRRNALVHGMPSLGRVQEGDRPGEATVMVAEGPESEDVTRAVEYYEAAKSFLEALVLAPPAAAGSEDNGKAG